MTTRVAQVFSRSDGIGSVLTNSEKNATCGLKKRKLTRDKKKRSEKPCGDKLGQLTRDSPTPQTIYRTKSYPGRPVAFPVFIRVWGN